MELNDIIKRYDNRAKNFRSRASKESNEARKASLLLRASDLEQVVEDLDALKQEELDANRLWGIKC